MNSHQQGCPKCGKENTANKLKSNVVDFIKKANKIYNNRYDYIKFNYKNYNTKGTIICNKLDKHGNKHGEFLQAPSNHLLGKEGCQKCFSNMTHLYQLGNINDFIKKANKIHNNKYDYSKFEYITARIKSIIICPEHGEFSCSPDNHQRDKGCPICNESKGEKRIRIFLQSNNIKFTRQKTFIDCINKKLRFDFYLDNYNICMEFDGIQHFKPIKFNSISDREAIKNFKKLKTLDKIKNRYCKNKNISLIRIPYTEIDRIEEIISDILKI
jgi:very-short-patch-repair endonuclease